LRRVAGSGRVMIPLDCTHCGKKLKVKVELAGRLVKCPGCGRPTPTPAPLAPAAPVGAKTPAISMPTPPVADPEFAVPTVVEATPRQSDQDSVSEVDSQTVVAGQYGTSLRFAPGGEAAETRDFLAPPQQPDEIGRLGPYRVLAILGTGGMGIVFRAEDPALGRPIALKAMLPEVARKPIAKERFFREARSAANLKHPHIVTIHSVGEDRGAPYLAMEFLEGEPLDQKLRRSASLPLAEILRIGREISLGLDAAHKKGLIHRDIKPANIWLEGDAGHVKILDFGLARAMGQQSQLTQSGMIVGTPAFMAPEQAAGKTIDHRADLFSLGCVLYRMTTGAIPFEGDDPLTTLSNLANVIPPPPALRNPGVPLPLSNLIVELLAKDPAKRPTSALEVAERLRAMEGEVNAETMIDGRMMAPRPMTTASQPSSATQAIAAPPKSRGGMLAPLAIMALLVAGGGGYYGYHAWYSPPSATKIAEPRPVRPARSAANPLDTLDPTQIPPSEREAWQPKELVALIGTRQMRHWSLPDTLVFSHDGQILASGCTQGNRPMVDGVRLWDTKTLREIAHLPDAGVPLSFTRDGTTLLTLSPKGSAMVWTIAAEPTLVSRLNGAATTTRWVSAVVSPDATVIAGLTPEKTIILLDLRTSPPRPIGELGGFVGNVGDMTFSPDGKTLAVSDEVHVRFWSLELSPPTELAPIESARRTALAFSPDGKSLAIGSFEDAELWDIRGVRPFLVSEISKGKFYSFMFTPDGRRLVSNDRGYVGFTDVPPRGVKPKAASNKETLGWSYQISAPRLSRDGKQLAFGDANAVRLFDVSGVKPVERTPAGAQYLASEFSADEKTLVCRASAETEIWAVLEGAFRRRAAIALESGDQRGPIAISGDGSLLLNHQPSASRLWRMGGDRPSLVGELPLAQLGQNRPVFGPQGRLLACPFENGQVELWDFTGDAQRKVASFQGHDKGIDRAFFGNDGKALGCLSREANSIHFWDIASDDPKREMVFEPPAGHTLISADLSPDAQTLATHLRGPSGAEQLWLWSVTPSEIKRRVILPNDGATPFIPFDAFSPDSSKIVTRTYGGANVAIWDAATGRRLHKWTFPGEVHWCDFAPDSRHLAVTNLNGTVYVLRLEAAAVR
jgi:serine/threonine protein kinase/WD40 repeat protein